MPTSPDNPLTGDEASVFEADVNIGLVTLDVSNNALYNLEEINNGIYTDYMVINHYWSDGHIWMMGMTKIDEGGDKAAFCKMAGSTLLWIADWTGEKSGFEPSKPDPDPKDDNLVLLDSIVEPMSMMEKPDGQTIVYRISGTYVYGFKDPSKATFYYGRPPWMATSVSCMVKPEVKRGIIKCDAEAASMGEGGGGMGGGGAGGGGGGGGAGGWLGVAGPPGFSTAGPVN